MPREEASTFQFILCSIWKPGDSNFWVKICLALEESICQVEWLIATLINLILSLATGSQSSIKICTCEVFGRERPLMLFLSSSTSSMVEMGIVHVLPHNLLVACLPQSPTTSPLGFGTTTTGLTH